MIVVSLSVTRTSAKGQVVIPQEIREDLGLEKGTLLLTYAAGDRVILKKLSKPEPGVFETLSEPIRMKLKEMEIEREDVKEAIREARKGSE